MPTKTSMADERADEKHEIINDTHGNNIDPVAEKKLLRKCDIRVLPPLFVLFLLAFLDRTNIGKLQTLTSSANANNRKAMRKSRA